MKLYIPQKILAETRSAVTNPFNQIKFLYMGKRLIDFAVRIIRTAESLPKTRAGNHIAWQLIRCGTSPAPNYGEAQSAESRSDFIHKMKVSLKELRETRIWLGGVNK